MKRIMYIAIGIIVLLIILVFTGNKSVHHEVNIESSSGTVWKTLTEMDKYPNWNPVMELLEGEVKEGNQVKYRFTQDENTASEIGATVKQIIPEKLLNQKGGIPLVLTFDHKYILEPSGDGTKVTIHEDYKGIGVNFWNPAPVEAAYGRLNEALKKQAEMLSN